ncbi:MAG TPA: anaerobic glycerol-3-phosphate dehydrogenase subunit C [Candidatus Acidoferrales bacterium]|nr:anaerobic glycerol-3-phosphate dehydrogenase subunit C [Candidatus Acidoferrales bacterium]
MATFFESKNFWDEPAVESELKRVFDICNGCRRCYNLCPSFNDMFERLDADAVDGDAEKLSAADFRSVTDLCYQCKLCFNHCPYTPPHRWEIDFPRLMLRSKAVQVKRAGQTLQDRFLGQVDRIGRLGALLAPLANWLNRNRLNRWLMEKLLGIHRDRILPRYASKTFRRWFDQRKAGAAVANGKKVALFYSCTVNFNYPEIGRACVRVLERNGVAVDCPAQRCCGMPFLDGGDLEATRENARANVGSLYALVEAGYDVVVPAPTCAYMLRREYPDLLGDERSRKVAEKTFDVCEYLMALHAEGKLDTRFVRGAGRVAYQIPCHLRAQNIGFKSRDLMQLLPDTTVRTIEKCSAIDGTWGLKRQYFDLSLKVAEPLLREIRDAQPDVTVSDCTLAGLQIEQGLRHKTLHPIQLIERAYGLDSEES